MAIMMLPFTYVCKRAFRPRQQSQLGCYFGTVRNWMVGGPSAL